MGLFDRKYCDVCGEKIGLLGNRKLEDANLCKKCAAKLSPWFNDRRHSTLEEIRAQLAYRERNRETVRAFHATRVFGSGCRKLMIDEDAGTFLIASSSNLAEENPDVVEVSSVTGCELDIRESRSEVYRKDDEGKNVSYDPKRYEYSYNFYVIIRVDHPYFDEMDFQLNRSSVQTGTRRIGEQGAPSSAGGAIDAILNAFAASAGSAQANAEYQEYVNQGNELKALLMRKRSEARGEAEAAPGERKAVTCPYCLATTFPTADGRCEYCGGALEE